MANIGKYTTTSRLLRTAIAAWEAVYRGPLAACEGAHEMHACFTTIGPSTMHSIQIVKKHNTMPRAVQNVPGAVPPTRHQRTSSRELLLLRLVGVTPPDAWTTGHTRVYKCQHVYELVLGASLCVSLAMGHTNVYKCQHV